MLAFVFVLSGFLLTLSNMGIMTGSWKLWPVFSLFLGVGGLIFFRKNGKADPLALAIGLFLIMISAFFFYLNFTGWAQMATLWPVFIFSAGTAILAGSLYSRKRRWFAMSGLLFVFMSVVFYMVFTLNGRLWPVSLILFGFWLVLVPERSSHEK